MFDEADRAHVRALAMAVGMILGGANRVLAAGGDELEVLNTVAYPQLHLCELPLACLAHIDLGQPPENRTDAYALVYVGRMRELVPAVWNAERRGMAPARQWLEIIAPALEQIQAELRAVRDGGV